MDNILSPLLSLPAELRLAILEHVFDSTHPTPGFKLSPTQTCLHDEDYTASPHLAPLLVCHQLYRDASLLALHKTHFHIPNLFCHIPSKLSLLAPKQLAALRSIAFVADARHFARMLDWGSAPFGVAGLALDTLTIVLHRSSQWHYLFDFTADLVRLLRRLRGVRQLVFVRNGASVKGSFRTWFNRLVGLVLVNDRHERFGRRPACLEEVWWSWGYESVAERCWFRAEEARPVMELEAYEEVMAPLAEELKAERGREEVNPDPRSWNGT